MMPIEDIFEFFSRYGAWIITILVFLFSYYTWNIGLYWFRKGVPGPIPLPIVGNFLPRIAGTMSIVDYDHLYYSDYGGKRYCGFFELNTKSIMIGDLNILRHILVKDFDNFVNRSNVKMSDPIVNKMVLVLHDDMWRKVRSLLTPAFSSGKIKAMIPIMVEESENLIQKILQNGRKNVDHELCNILRKYAVDIVATIAFGIEIKDLKNQEDEFTKNAREIFMSAPKWKRFFYLFMRTFPFLIPLTNFKIRDEKAPLFFKKIIEETLKYRKENKIVRNDFLQMLKEAKDKEENNYNKVLADDVFLAQCITFFAAGVDTVSTTLALVLNTLAFHQDIQTKVINEIDETLKNYEGNITYDAVCDMKYLDLVLQETERMFPSAPRTYRVCQNSYTLPGTDITLEPNTAVIVPIRCIHYDPENFRDPETFYPERFSPENKTYSNTNAFFTFGEGPRNCIGMRFATMEMKVFLATLLKQARVHPGPKSRYPPKFDKLSGVQKVSGGVWLRISEKSY